MKKKQRKLGGQKDEFIVRVPPEVGKKIRESADKKGMSYSAYIGDTVEKALIRESQQTKESRTSKQEKKNTQKQG